MKRDGVGGGKSSVTGIANSIQITLATIGRIREDHIIPVRIFDPIQAPTEDVGSIRRVGDPGVPSLAKEILFAGPVGRQEERLAIRGGPFLQSGEPPFYF